MSKEEYKICSRCVMDTSDKFIVFDSNGVCNHCHEYDKVVKPYLLNAQKKKEKLEVIVSKIKEAGKGRKYDCIAGLSGGLDSSYVLYLAKKLQLRTLIVHFDNGWDSELAIKNIDNIVNKTGFEYYNYVVDWEEFKDLQRSYFKASVVDVEVTTDMGIFSMISQLALKYDVKYILHGNNVESEFTMGKNWNFSKSDRGNLLDIHNKYGTKELKSFPYFTPFQQLIFKAKRIKKVNILEYDECNYSIIREVLKQEFNWQYYGVKHGESTFTKFYQSYYLPKKFGIDKRKAHLSDQINSNHISRTQALEILDKPVYNSAEEEKAEYDYVIKKLGFSIEEFEAIMNAPEVPHSAYAINKPYGSLWDKLILKVLDVKLVYGGLARLFDIINKVK